MPEERTAVLLVDSYTTTCSKCRNGAFTKDIRHDRIATGWGTPDPRDKPCGARFVAISTKRQEYTQDDLHQLRPDLPAYEAGKAPRDLTT
ncbi:hypothetical protein [Streptomyces spectabilis]|uniref:Uncharacterized protein n=1 Tax=Streptomyces spectabilis TaxID=68270 RepID=A0A5P2X468_STRST|nr:hypothetical protein [Streptomyces spectabilis]MBB5103278.1 hypothetical protein [Streptomyces spectabilis]MCI3902469.1 hypothetical protein [Streptomyces spectabilis]QEV59807.1 hypothetical protein CP982_14545 [Streptomyces spectabilis]GGV13671.1 hypothetical protein GCM10010245_23860 [Streptomyces spectabilis]